MYVLIPRASAVCAALLSLFVFLPDPVSAQAPASEVHQHDAAEHEHGPGAAAGLAEEVSGTALLPATMPHYAWEQRVGSWMWMTHANLFVQYLHDAGDRGHAQGGSINWLMAMGHRPLGGGQLGVQGMVSAEPWTIGGCGYPDLLASGEQCGREAIHDQQHPHDALMELSVRYTRPLVNSMSWEVYGGMAGEPALGPVAFPHRPSSMANPLAPISHHWLDSTHITFGVVTGAVAGRSWKVETSAFNGREPDERRTDVDLGRLDSVSGRVTWLPRPTLALQVSAGHLADAEPAHAGEPAVDVNRVTASLVHQRRVGAQAWWASTVAWGRNAAHGGATHAVLAESTVTVRERDAVFGRVEVVGKEAHDLGLHGPRQVFTVSKAQLGYTRYAAVVPHLQTGLGVSVSAGIVPEPLRTLYGSRINGGAAVFLVVRPARQSE